MKTRLLFTLLLSIAFGFSYAQSLELSYEGEPLEHNAEVVVEGSAFDPEIVAELDVTNTGSSDLDIWVQRYEEEMVPGTMSYFCWGLCYAPSVNLSLVSINIPAGATNDIDFSAHYSANGNSGQSIVSFTLYDDANPNDSVSVRFFFQGLITDIKEQAKNDIKAYPVPANDYITLEMPDLSGAEYQVEILNLTGAVLKTVQSTNSKVQISTQEMHNGIYFYRVSNGKEYIAVDRFVVQH